MIIRHGDRGSVTAEFAVVVPAVVLVVLLTAATLTGAARQVRLEQAVAQAARLAARGESDARVQAVAAALGRPVVVDAEARVAAVALDGETRRRALTELVAPSFELPDLDGNLHALEEWHDRKKLLVAFASW